MNDYRLDVNYGDYARPGEHYFEARDHDAADIKARIILADCDGATHGDLYVRDGRDALWCDSIVPA